MHVVTRNIGLQALGTFREYQFVVLYQTGSEYTIDVVHPRITAIDVFCDIQFIHPVVIHQCLCIGLCIHLLRQSGSFRETDRRIEGDAALPSHPTFSGNNDYPVSSSRTINGSRRSILQNLHTLNVFRIDAFQTGFAHHTIHHIQWFIAFINGVGTTDTNFD